MPNITIDIAEAKPRLYSLKAVVYTKYPMLIVENSGPPLVIMYTFEKVWKFAIVPIMSAYRIVGLSRGIVTLVKTFHDEAPSSLAASK